MVALPLALVLLLVTAAPEGAAAPAPPAPAKKPAPEVPPWLPTPLGWAGMGGLGVSGGVGLLGLVLSGVGAASVVQGQREQSAADASGGSDFVAQQQRSSHTRAARDAYDRARVLFALGAATVTAALLGSLASAVVIAVDDTFLVPARKARHPLWEILGPLAGSRDPAPAWPDWPVPPVKGLFLPPEDAPAPAPAPVNPEDHAAPAPESAPVPPAANGDALPPGDDPAPAPGKR